MEETNYTSNTINVNKLDEVKELIFGQNIKEYNEKLNLLQSNINDNKLELISKIDEVKSHLMQAIDATEKNMADRMTALHQALEQELNRQEKAHVSRQSMSDVMSKIANAIVE